MLNPLHLRTLTAVMETGSFALAARQLGYTPSAVSQQIASLERGTGMLLFEREARSIRPTPCAEFLTQRAGKVLGALGQLQDEISGLIDGVAGIVRVGSFPTASEHLMPAALAHLNETFPGVELRLDEGEPAELLPRIEVGELDVAVVYDYSRVPRRANPNLCQRPLLSEELRLTLPSLHQLAGEEQIDLADLADADWVATRAGTAGAVNLERVCADAGFHPRVSYRSNDYDVVRALVCSMLGVALVPALSYVEATGVVVRPCAAGSSHRRVSTVTRAGTSNPLIRAVLAALDKSVRAVADERRGLLQSANVSA